MAVAGEHFAVHISSISNCLMVMTVAVLGGILFYMQMVSSARPPPLGNAMRR